VDYGQHWGPLTNFPVTGPTGTAADPGVGVIFAHFDKSSGVADTGFTRVAYIGVSDPTVGLYTTQDGGKTFAAVAGQPTGLYPNSMSTDPSGNLYIAYGGSSYGNSVGPYSMNTGAIWRYAPATGTWTNITPPNPNKESYGFGSVAVDPVDPNIILVTTMDRYYPPPQDDLFRSIDGGQTWKSIETNAVRDVSRSPWVTFGAAKAGFGNWANHIYINPSNHNQVSYGDGQTIWTTDNIAAADSVATTPGSIVVGGATNWYVDALGVEETAVNALASPPSGPAHLLSGMYDLGGFTHTDLRQSPQQGANIKPNIGAIGNIAYAQKKPLRIAQTGNSAPFGAYSTDGGLTFQPFATLPAALKSGAGTVAFTADGDTLQWAPSDAGTQTYFSNDYGTTWTVSGNSPTSTGAYNAIEVFGDPVDPQTVYEYNPVTGILYASSNRGQSVAPVSTLATYGTLYVSPAAKGDLWLTTGTALLHSTDGGKTFSANADVNAAYNLGFGAPYAGSAYPTLFLRGQVDQFPNGFDAFFASIDDGKTWYVVNDEQHQYGNTTLLIGDSRVPGRFYIATNGLGIVEGDVAQ
jgi:photosystem II stability/assembly factor-like uncharacterized protein